MSFARIRHRPTHRLRSENPVPAVILLCISLLPAHAAAQHAKPTHPSPEAILRLSIDSERTVNMRGVETVNVIPPNGNGIATVTREVTRTHDGMSLTRWTDPIEQRGMVLLDDGTWTKCYLPSEGFTKISRSTPRPRDSKAAARLLRLILRNYRVSYEGIEPMASRGCYKIQLTPRHPISRVVRLWVDRKTGAVLSRMEQTPRGDTLKISTFNGVEYPQRIDPAILRRAVPAKAKQITYSRSPLLYSFAEVRRRVPFEFCPPFAMPGGYEFDHAEIVSFDGVASTWLRYTDGVGVITICQNRTATEPRPNGYRVTYCNVNQMRDSVVEHQVGPMTFSLVGHCSMDGLVAVADALDTAKERAYLSSLARSYRVPMQTVVKLRNQGAGTDTLDALLALSQQTHQSPSSLLALCKEEGGGWIALARRFRADVRRILQHARDFACK